MPLLASKFSQTVMLGINVGNRRLRNCLVRWQLKDFFWGLYS